MHALRKLSLATLIATCDLALAVPTMAQDYPTKPVRVITGNPGSMTDIVTRQLGQRLGERWGQPVVVENRGGAGITVGSGFVAKSPPDGYTLLIADRTSIAVAPNLHKNLSYDPIRDFAPISLVAVAPQLLVAHLSVPAVNLREFIGYVKERPGAVDYASAGPGTAIHITGELLKQVAGIDMVPIQYKGGGAAMIAILSGEVKAGFGLMPVALPHVKAGKVKAYAITSKQRSSEAPDIPTMAEAGLPSFGSEYYWMGMFAPAHTQAAIVGKLNRDIVEILQTPAMQATLRAQGAEPAPGTPEEFAAFIKTETAKLKKLIELTGMRAD